MVSSLTLNEKRSQNKIVFSYSRNGMDIITQDNIDRLIDLDAEQIKSLYLWLQCIQDNLVIEEE